VVYATHIRVTIVDRGAWGGQHSAQRLGYCEGFFQVSSCAVAHVATG
jgi:hypothetical protein